MILAAFEWNVNKGLLEDVELSNLNVVIIGLGLMGGSLAMALRGSVGKLTGIDRKGKTCRLAVARGIVDDATPLLNEGVASADLVVLAVPVRSIVAILKDLPAMRPDGCMVIDLGSTKGEIEETMVDLPNQFAAIGGHPMCGREHSGLGAASADLYERQTFVLCRNSRTTKAIGDLARRLVQEIGAKPLAMSAERHDQLVATTSHLPYVVASVLMQRAWQTAQQDERLWLVSASGLRDTTRLAGSNPEMMLEILMTNRPSILRQLESYRDDLDRIAQLLKTGDEAALRQSLKDAQRQRAEYFESKYGDGNPS